ncbi:MAG: arginine--tRNA ligase [Spirochaetota bacterium]|nr:MAG: arginine--tRNA ligase [Spirochaetota bacterium]
MAVDIKGRLSEYFVSIIPVDKEKIISLLEKPSNPGFGDYAIPCFEMAKEKKKRPDELAKELSSRFEGNEIIVRAEARGAYLNLFINRSYFTGEVVKEISRKGFLGLSKKGKNKTVVMDYSSPNIAKPFGIGHLRSTVIGNSLKKIFSFLGYRVIGINHIGDWGTQFGKLITAFKKWGNDDSLKHDPINYLYDLYVQFHRESEKDPSLEDVAREWFNLLEKKDSEATLIWKKFRDLSIEEFRRIYHRLGVEFEHYTGESFYSDMLDSTVEKVQASKITEVSEDALIVPLDDMPPAMLRKKDGSTLYLTRDIAAVLYRKERYNFDLALYVVGSPQMLHFRQLFKVLEKMGIKWGSQCHHIPFGQIRFEDQSMSTRKGNIIFLEEVMDKAVGLASKIIDEKSPHIDNKMDVAEAVGVGSIIFNDLRNSRIKDITFNWNEVLNFNGETGVYLQYTHARISSLLEKYSQKAGGVSYDDSLQFGEEGYDIAILLNDFEDTILKSAQDFEPSIIARYLLELASAFNTFYNAHRVITEDEGISRTRALVVLCVQKVLKTGLELLGIKVVEEM